MKVYSTLPGLVVVVCLLVLGSQSFGFQSEERYVDGEVLVRLAGPLPPPKVLILGKQAPAPVPDQFRGLAEEHGLFEVQSLAAPPPGMAKPVQGEGMVGRPIYLFRFPADSDVPTLVKSLSAIPGVVYAEPNYIGRLAYTPSNDPYYAQTSDHLGHLGVPTAWDYQTGGISSVIVAVIDSGVDAMHPDLDDALHTSSKNIADDNTQIFDDQDHGTRVAGIIAAEENNAEGIAGIAFGVQILSLDVTDSGGHLSTDDVIEAVNYAVAQGAKVINMSFEFSSRSQSLQDTLEDAAESAVLVAAAGNQGQGDSPVYPASFSCVVGVGATEVDSDTRTTFSNFNGSETTLVDLVAPGKSIYSTRVGSLYDGLFTSGTSFSAPMVSGIAALLQSKYPTQSPQGIVNHLLATAVDVDTWAGYGRVSASNALSTALLPSLSVASVEIDDSTSIDAGNDADEAWDKGETVSLVIYLQNDGGDAVSVTGTLTTTDSDVTIDDSSGGWGNIDAGESGSPTNAVIVTATAGALSHNATMELSISATSTEAEVYAATLPFFARIENAQVITSGNYIGTAEHWTSGQTYEVMVDQIFSFGASLSVDPGTVVKLAPDVDIIMNSGTTLTANGTASSPILFTSLNSPVSSRIGPKTEAVNLGAYDQVRYVADASGSDATGTGSSSNPWKTVGHALSDIVTAGSSNTYALVVAEGVYRDPAGTIAMKEYIDMYGGYEASGWTRDIFAHPSVLDGEDTRTVVSATDNVRLDGFVVVRGKSGSAGGINCGDLSPTITNNVITQNEGTNGGAIRNYSGSPTISNNLICGNLNGGIWTLSNGAPIITKNFICGNIATGAGGGVGHAYTGSATITNNVISGNSAGLAGGGIGWGAPSGTLINNLIADNLNDGLAVQDGCSPTVTNTIVYGNEGYQIGGGSPVVTYCDVEGGYTGTGNIDADPEFSRDGLWGVVVEQEFDEIGCQTTLTDGYRTSLGPTNSLRGRPVHLGERYFVIAGNSGNTFTVWGFTAINFEEPPWAYEVLPTYHLTSGSPCADAGTNTGAPSDDIDGDSRPVNGTVDIGVDEYDPSNPSEGYVWGRINIKSGATSSMQHCTVENGEGVLTASSSATFANCTFEANSEWGLESAGGSGTISSCTATLNLAGGINDATRNLTSCVAQYNGGDGLIGAALTGCTAYRNGGTGLAGSSASNCDATFNAGDGIDSSGAVSDCLGWDNRGKGIVCASGDVTDSTASRNDNVGLEITGAGTALRCVASQNDGGGIITNGATVSSCTIEENVGAGVTGTGGAALTDCSVHMNEGAAVSGVSTITACRIVGNATGVSGASTVSGSFVQMNGVYGVFGGAVSDSSIVGNEGFGISAPTSVTNSWIVFNHYTGIDAPTGDVTYCSILTNGDKGVANIPNSASLSYSNIYGNSLYDYYDTDNTNTTGALWKDVRSNYWGTATTAEMSGNPAPTVDITQIYDLWDNGLANGYYANYGGDGSPFPGPLAPTSPVANAPDDAAPAFLMEATPKLIPAVNVGLTTFTLVFSEAMDTSVAPAVTFDTTAPYTAHVVDASPGWVDTLTWQGVYAVDDETGDGENSILVSGAKAADGSVFDAGMLFAIDTTAGLSDIFNLQVATVGPDSLYLTWDSTRNISELSGFVIERSTYQDFHVYDFLGSPEPPTTMEYTDSDGLSAGTTYWYKVYESDLGANSNQGGAVQSGTTESAGTPTPTATQTPEPTSTIPVWLRITGHETEAWKVYR